MERVLPQASDDTARQGGAPGVADSATQWGGEMPRPSTEATWTTEGLRPVAPQHPGPDAGWTGAALAAESQGVAPNQTAALQGSASAIPHGTGQGGAVLTDSATHSDGETPGPSAGTNWPKNEEDLGLGLRPATSPDHDGQKGHSAATAEAPPKSRVPAPDVGPNPAALPGGPRLGGAPALGEATERLIAPQPADRQKATAGPAPTAPPAEPGGPGPAPAQAVGLNPLTAPGTVTATEERTIATQQPGRQKADAARPAGTDAPTEPAPRIVPAYWPDGIDSRLGAVFYLINLMEHLGLPACFEPDWPLTPWATLELLARGLLASTGETYLYDSLWLVLGALDGRVKEVPPGADLPALAPYRLPPAWLSALKAEEAKAGLTMTENHLTCTHEAGFTLLDLPGGGEPDSELLLYPGLTTELTAPTPQDQEPSPLLDQLTNPARRWLRLTLPYIRLRLLRALGWPPATDLATDLLAVPARIYVTRSHVDVVMRMNAVSLPVRLAGLDQNPGWARRFARVITFHFR